MWPATPGASSPTQGDLLWSDLDWINDTGMSCSVTGSTILPLGISSYTAVELNPLNDQTKSCPTNESEVLFSLPENSLCIARDLNSPTSCLPPTQLPLSSPVPTVPLCTKPDSPSSPSPLAKVPCPSSKPTIPSCSSDLESPTPPSPVAEAYTCLSQGEPSSASTSNL